MTRSQRRLLLLFLTVPLLLVVSAMLYQWGMAELEGQGRGFWDALGWAGETITTTGYGGDSHWSHPLMVVFVVLLQFVGVFLVFLVFPIYVIPFLEERFETRLPTDAGDAEDHVVIFRYGPPVTTLVSRLAAEGVESVTVEPDSAVARRLSERGQHVVVRSLDDGALGAARIERARALIANGRDDENAAVILAARQRGFSGEALAVVEEPLHRKPMMLAGATAVYTPRHILGAALAARASARISPRLSGIQHLGRKLALREIRIQSGSELAGRTLAEAAIGAETGATVVAQWVEGRLEREPTANTRLVSGGILVAVGSDESLDRLAARAGAVVLRQEGPFVIGGFGEVGRKVAQLLSDAGETVRVIDKERYEGVDLEGDVLDPELLQRAGVDEAQAVVLALNTDAATLFATVIVKDLAPAVPVIARVNQAENVERIHRAGADFALSISQVSGQMLARRLLGEEVVAIDASLQVRKTSAEGMVGQHPSALRLRERTGCSMVAVERGDEVLVHFPPEFRFAAGDAVYLAGSNEAVARFQEKLGTG
jgi:Trk K+ transport system NAD-binding subunit